MNEEQKKDFAIRTELFSGKLRELMALTDIGLKPQITPDGPTLIIVDVKKYEPVIENKAKKQKQ